MQKRRSWLGFFGSLFFHSSILAVLLLAFKTNDESASSHDGLISTNISMEMMMATVAEEPPLPQPEPTPVVQPEPIAKEEVADPTIKPEPPKPEKPKEPEKKEEKPKEKPKEREKPKEKPKEKAKKVEKPQEARKDLPKAERTVEGNANINSQATTLAKATTNNPNLVGSGGSADEKAAYSSALRREIERHKRYPQRAKMMRKQGTVTVSFNIGADGAISGARVSKSSGNDDLDNAAIQAVQSARPIGPRPVGMGSSISVPINFTIR